MRVSQTYRSGTLAILLLMTRRVGVNPTVPITHCWSTMISLSSYPSLFRSAFSTPNPFLRMSYALSSSGSSGFLPAVPLEAYQVA